MRSVQHSGCRRDTRKATAGQSVLGYGQPCLFNLAWLFFSSPTARREIEKTARGLQADLEAANKEAPPGELFVMNRFIYNSGSDIYINIDG